MGASDAPLFPRCPKCANGGDVRLVYVSTTAQAVFNPLPKGWKDTAPAYQCECGWTELVSDAEFATRSV